MRLSPRPDVWWTALGSDHWATRAYAAENIARFGDPGSVAALHVALRDEAHPSVLTLARFGERLRARAHSDRVRFGWPAPPPSTTITPLTHP
jgi:HEAT repeat protein